MNDPIFSLSNLRDIAMPDAPPLWPPALSLWILIGITVAAIFVLLWQLHGIRKRNAYRRAGLALLKDARTAYDVSLILKRVALAVYPRQQVASLYAAEWAAFLGSVCPRRDFSKVGTMIPDDGADREIMDLARVWIRHHHLPEHSRLHSEH